MIMSLKMIEDKSAFYLVCKTETEKEKEFKYQIQRYKFDEYGEMEFVCAYNLSHEEVKDDDG